jgi:hypothetical protein
MVSRAVVKYAWKVSDFPEAHLGSLNGIAVVDLITHASSEVFLCGNPISSNACLQVKLTKISSAITQHYVQYGTGCIGARDQWSSLPCFHKENQDNFI